MQHAFCTHFKPWPHHSRSCWEKKEEQSQIIPFLRVTMFLHSFKLLGFYQRQVIANLPHVTSQVRRMLEARACSRALVTALGLGAATLTPPSLPARAWGPAQAVHTQHVALRSLAQQLDTSPVPRARDTHRERLHMPVLARSRKPLTPSFILANCYRGLKNPPFGPYTTEQQH